MTQIYERIQEWEDYFIKKYKTKLNNLSKQLKSLKTVKNILQVLLNLRTAQTYDGNYQIDDARDIVCENRSDLNQHTQLIHFLISEEATGTTESTKRASKSLK